MKKNLLPMNEFGLMADSEGVIRVDSRWVAGAFDKNHKDVLRSIKQIIGKESGYSKNFTERNFAPSTYKDVTGRQLPCYLMTRDGFSLLVFGFTGDKAAQFKEAYIQRFNEMEAQLIRIQSLRDMNPMLTKAIQETRKDPKPYDYSNEADMLNRIVLGVSAKQYREQNGIPKSDLIRPHFTQEEVELMDQLVTMDIGLQYSTPDYQQRKQMLEWKAFKWREEQKKQKQVLLPDDQDALAS